MTFEMGGIVSRGIFCCYESDVFRYDPVLPAIRFSFRGVDSVLERNNQVIYFFQSRNIKYINLTFNHPLTSPKDQVVGLDIDRNNIKMNLNEKCGLDSSGSGYVPVPVSCET
jgi:hypothetical protein